MTRAKAKISVVLPIFGTFDRDKLFLAVESIKMQDYPNVEIIISEQNNESTCRAFAKQQNITYTFSKMRQDDSVYNIGYVRNQGIKAATGAYLYLTDSDIVFMGTTFLSEVLALYKKQKPAYLRYPPMRRMLEVHLDDFYQSTLTQGIGQAISQLRFPDGYTTTVDEKDKIIVVKYGYYKKKYTIPQKYFKKISKKDLEKYGYGLMFFTTHPGTIFTETKHVVALGGYYEGFRGWGYDDVDLQVRLTALTNKRANAMPNKVAFRVLHLDHKMNFRKDLYHINEAAFFERCEIPVKKLSKADRTANKF